MTPAGIHALAITIPTDTREITLPNGKTALRHTMPEDVDGLDLEKDVARKVLDAAGVEPGEIDLCMSASFPALPEPCIGNATPMAWDLGMVEAASYTLESACAGGLVGLRTACNEVRLGEYSKILLTVTCPYSPTVEPGHPATDVIADAAFALLIGPTAPGREFLGSVIRNSGPTCPLVSWGVSDKTRSGIRLEVGHKTAGNLESWAMTQIPVLAERLFKRCGVKPEEVDHWVSNAPTPAFVDRALATLGTSPMNGVNTNRIAGNVGPALIGVSLFYNAILRGFKPGDLILLLSVGSEASLAMGLMRWPDDVVLGPVPEHAPVEMLARFEEERRAEVEAG